MTTAATAIDEVERLQARLNALEQERKHLLAVVEILQDIGGSLQFGDIVRSVTLRLGETFGLDRCSIFLAERGGRSVRLVASYEDPGIRNYVVDLDRYPELRRALQTGETVFIADASTDPSLGSARWALAARKVKTITVIPITWRGAAIGAIFLRTFRDGPAFSADDLAFCQVVANLTAKALRNAHRFDRLRQRQGDNDAQRRREHEQAALLEFMRRLLADYPRGGGRDDEMGLGSTGSDEIERLVGVAQAVLSQEVASR
jgi:GAF domain-containing protein